MPASPVARGVKIRDMAPKKYDSDDDEEEDMQREEEYQFNRPKRGFGGSDSPLCKEFSLGFSGQPEDQDNEIELRRPRNNNNRGANIFNQAA